MAIPTRSIYVGNVPYASTVQSLMEAFADYEPVSIKLIEGRGVAYVEVPAKRAYAMVRDTDGSKLEGRMLSVSVARPRENEPTMRQEEQRPGYNRPQSGERGSYQSDRERPAAPGRGGSGDGSDRWRPRGPEQFQNGRLPSDAARPNFSDGPERPRGEKPEPTLPAEADQRTPTRPDRSRFSARPGENSWNAQSRKPESASGTPGEESSSEFTPKPPGSKPRRIFRKP